MFCCHALGSLGTRHPRMRIRIAAVHCRAAVALWRRHGVDTRECNRRNSQLRRMNSSKARRVSTGWPTGGPRGTWLRGMRSSQTTSFTLHHITSHYIHVTGIVHTVLHLHLEVGAAHACSPFRLTLCCPPLCRLRHVPATPSNGSIAPESPSHTYTTSPRKGGATGVIHLSRACAASRSMRAAFVRSSDRKSVV